MPKQPGSQLIFKKDVKKIGSYVYTQESIYSAVVANQKQSDEITIAINNLIGPGTNTIDIGCGDGKYTRELAERIKFKQLVGIDPVVRAINIAKKKYLLAAPPCLKYGLGDVYSFEPACCYDLAILRGVLHHLDDPEKAVRQIGLTCQQVLILEPNGYNLILKLIEKLSPYHQEHQEKSYPPSKIRSWFRDNHYHLKYDKYIALVPFFCPQIVAKILKVIEKYVENIPLINRFYCGQYLAVFEKD